MVALIVRIFGCILAAVGGFTMTGLLMHEALLENVLLAALLLFLGAAMIVVSVLAPRFGEKTRVVENCLGYPLRINMEGEIVITCPRDVVEAKLFCGEINFDKYVEKIALFEYRVKGDSRRAQLARAHNQTTLLSSEYADELAALAEEISALRDRYASGEISDKEYQAQLDELRPSY